MKKSNSSFVVLLLVLGLVLGSCSSPEQTDEQNGHTEIVTQKKADYAIAIHGGAGTIKRENMTAEMEAEYLATLNAALDIGEGILQNGGSSMDAVEQTVIHLENSPLFNAGKGAVFTNSGRNELDASFMDGATRNAGAVGGVTIVKNPITAARAVLEKSEHVMLTGAGAEQFAIEQGLDTVSNDYFFTQKRWDALQRVKAAEDQSSGQLLDFPDRKFGTVGCVALDKNGNLAAGTSTGGMTNKRYNRIGDSPIIGAGTYALNNTCAVSSTGHGEYFIRFAVAYDISALMEYKGLDLQSAADLVIYKKLKDAGGTGGVISVDKYGNVAMPFNTSGMYRGYAKSGERVAKIYED